MERPGRTFSVRRATEYDDEAIVAILTGVAAERIYTAIDMPWSVDEQRQYLKSLTPRETYHVAQTDRHTLVGYQSLDLYAPTLHSMAHVAQLGTFLRPEWRRQGVGEALFAATVEFARQHAYRKLVVQVRASNTGAQAFYKRLGFQECGRLAKQVRIGDQDDDEILMELFV